MTDGTLAERLSIDGVALVRAALSEAALAALWSMLEPETAVGAVRAGEREAYGARGLLLSRPRLGETLAELSLDRIAAEVLGVPGFAIDAMFFDKHGDVNWAVPAHQDVVVPVPVGAGADAARHIRCRHGVRYGEPAALVLQELVALRVHFDDALASNGGLSLATGSHVRGRLSDAEIRQLPHAAYRPYDCRTGDVLLMRPLVVHRSPRSLGATHRRVLHVLYAPRDGWHDRFATHAR